MKPVKISLIYFTILVGVLFYAIKVLSSGMLEISFIVYSLTLIFAGVSSIVLRIILPEKALIKLTIITLFFVALLFLSTLVFTELSPAIHFLILIGSVGLASIFEVFLQKPFSLALLKQKNLPIFCLSLVVIFLTSVSPNFFVASNSLLEPNSSDPFFSYTDSNKKTRNNTNLDLEGSNQQYKSTVESEQIQNNYNNYNDEGVDTSNFDKDLFMDSYRNKLRKEGCMELMSDQFKKYQAEMDRFTEEYYNKLNQIDDRYFNRWQTDPELQGMPFSTREEWRQLDRKEAYNSYILQYNLAKSMRDKKPTGCEL